MTPAEGSTIIGKSVTIRGELSGKEDLFMDGIVEGTISLPESLRPPLRATHGRRINMRPGSTQESQHRPQHEADGPDATPLFQHGELPTPHEPKTIRDELHRRSDRRNPASDVSEKNREMKYSGH